MSAITGNNIASWRKRALEDDSSSPSPKRPRCNYYRLASESSRGSEEDTESVRSLQDKETDTIHDTSDTDTKSDCSNKDEYEVEIEYEVASLSEEDYLSGSSTGSEDMMMAAAAVAAVIYDTSLEAQMTDSEDSDSSSIDTSFTRSFSTCIQCKFENNNPLYRYCEKCFQDRKKYFPPRPRGFRRRKKVEKPPEPAVKLDTLRSCLSGLSSMSQDSGIGSSQECPQLDLHRIVVPEHHLTQGTSTSSLQGNSSVDETAKGCSSDLSSFEVRNGSSSSFDSGVETKSAELMPKKSSLAEETDHDIIKANAAKSDLCMFCNSAPKDGIFLHTNIAHVCCCYKCAKKTLNTIKRCPICNRPVNKVVKIFTS